MKLIKWIAFSLTALLVFLLIWANWNPPSIAQTMSDKYFVLLECSDELSKDSEEDFLNIEGVTNVFVEKNLRDVTIMYETRITDADRIQQEAESKTGMDVNVKEVPSSGGVCPMSTWGIYVKNVKDLFCFRAPQPQID